MVDTCWIVPAPFRFNQSPILLPFYSAWMECFLFWTDLKQKMKRHIWPPLIHWVSGRVFSDKSLTGAHRRVSSSRFMFYSSQWGWWGESYEVKKKSYFSYADFYIIHILDSLSAINLDNFPVLWILLPGRRLLLYGWNSWVIQTSFRSFWVTFNAKIWNIIFHRRKCFRRIMGSCKPVLFLVKSFKS